MSLCILLCFTALAIHYFFDAAAYDVYLPMAAGLCTSLFMTTRPLIDQAERGDARAESRAETMSVPAVAATGPSLPQARSDRQSRNPYRLGRRRVPKK